MVTVYLFIQQLTENPALYFSWISIVAFSICIHEYAHAAMAFHYGDDTAARRGHLSLNPMVQLGPFSLVLLAVIGLAWGSVPVDESRLNGRKQVATVAFAGPMANLALVACFALLATLSTYIQGPFGKQAQWFLQIGSFTNAMLFWLNILPLPMLDGWRILSALVPRFNTFTTAYKAYVPILLIVVILFTPLFNWIWSLGAATAGLFTMVFAAVLP